MRLDLRSIIHVPGASVPFVFELDLSALDFFGEKPLKKAVHVSGFVRNRADTLVLEGAAEGVMDVFCDRCLKPFSKEFCVPVDTMLAEKLEDEENDEIILLENGVLDLGEIFTTAVVLSMDMRHLCAEDCKGLCVKCGADLNSGPCGCRKEMDPRLAALAQLLDKE